MNGDYLIAHAREWKDWKATKPKTPTKSFLARKELAQYNNIAATILDQKASAMFREPITRTVGKDGSGEHPLERWWKDVDGAGCDINSYMSDSFLAAGVYGHVFHYLDRDQLGDGSESYTAADIDTPYLRTYLPLDMPDWISDGRGRLKEVSLLEPYDPRTTVKEAYNPQGYRLRIVNADGWELYGNGKDLISSGPHTLGILPIVTHYATRRRMEPLIGEPILGDPNSHIDIYNIDSEIRAMLRGQTFGILNAPLGTGDQMVDVEKAKALMQDEKGIDNVMFTPLPAQYIQPDAGNVTVYQEERKLRVREIFRKASVAFESDSKDAEAEGSLKLKREDMNQTLSKYCDECEKTEYAIARLWFRDQYGDSDWEQRFEDAEVVIRYPDVFEPTPFTEILEQAQAAITLEMPPTFMREVKKRLIPKFLPDAPPQVIEDIEKELEKAAKQAATMDQQTHQASLKSIASGENPDAPFGQRPAA